MTALAAALEVLAPIRDGKDEAQALIAAKCAGLMAGYAKRWANAPYQIEDVEVVVSSDLYNPETQRKSRSFTVSGKIDVKVRDLNTGARAIIDHKTTSDDITDPNGPYWRQLVVEAQPTHYMLLEWLNGRKVDYAVWDVCRKPSIRPKSLTKKEAEVFVNSGEYFGVELPYEDFEATGRETPRMYEARLAFDCGEERPEWYFQRRQVPRLDAEIREYAQELWDHGQEILSARANDRWQRNSGACMLYGSPCGFLNVCSGYDSIDSPGWTRREWVHPELPIIQGDHRGVDVLTNSRIRCFQTCRRQHQFRYEIGAEKISEEETEARWLGTLFHQALERYFLALKEQQQKGAA